MLENKFKTLLIKDLKILFPGCLIFHLDPNLIQGSPDLLLLWNDKWAALEGKKSRHENVQPNQNYYIDKMNKMSYAAFIYPENKEVILDEIQDAFRVRR